MVTVCNSSRFGRFTEVHFLDSGKIRGARIDNFLLEKSRVVWQQRGERNYHIFYQLAASRRAQQYGVSECEHYHYLNQSQCYTVDGVDDALDFDVMLQAMVDLGFTTAEADWVLQLVAAILHLGNVDFVSDGGEGSRFGTTASAATGWAAKLLQVELGPLEFGLTHRSIEVRGIVTNIPLKPDAAKTSRDALSKSIYGQLFDW